MAKFDCVFRTSYFYVTDEKKYEEFKRHIVVGDNTNNINFWHKRGDRIESDSIKPNTDEAIKHAFGGHTQIKGYVEDIEHYDRDLMDPSPVVEEGADRQPVSCLAQRHHGHALGTEHLRVYALSGQRGTGGRRKMLKFYKVEIRPHEFEVDVWAVSPEEAEDKAFSEMQNNIGACDCNFDTEEIAEDRDEREVA